MENGVTYRIFPLGDSALTIEFGNQIDEAVNDKVLALTQQLQNLSLSGVIEVVPAYNTISLFYDLAVVSHVKKATTGFEWMKQLLETEVQKNILSETIKGRSIRIPVCYGNEQGPDLATLAMKKGLSVEEVIQLHCSRTYRIYMLGFLPGFPYMGKVDERISMPRKPQPENVLAGSVGIAGIQTGIYPLPSPGGWSIIARTPLKLFDSSNADPVLLRMGDTVVFYPITKDEFESY